MPPYSKQFWQSDTINSPYGPIDGARLQHIEDGLEAISNGGVLAIGSSSFSIDPGTGDLVFTTNGVERGRVREDGSTSGIFGGTGAPATATYIVTVTGSPNSATYTAYDRSGNVARTATDTATTSGLKNVLQNLAADGVHFHFTGGRFHFLDAPIGTEAWANTEPGASFSQFKGLMFTGEGMTKTIMSSRSNTITASPDLAVFLFTNCQQATIRDMQIEQCGAYMSTMEAVNFNQGADCQIERVRFMRAKSTAFTFDGGDDGKIANRNVVRDCIFMGRPPIPQVTYTTTGGGLANATTYQYALAYRDADSGYFTAVTGASSGTTATLTFGSAHGFNAGEQISVQGMSVPGYNGQYTIVSVPTTTTLTYVTVGSGLAAGSGATVIGPGTSKLSDPSSPFLTTTGTTKATVTVPLGPYTTTQRLVYRYNGTNWKLVQTVADNTTTLWVDTTTDASGTVVAMPVSFKSNIPHSGIQLLANTGTVVQANIVDGCGDGDISGAANQGIRLAQKNNKQCNENIISANRVRASGGHGIGLFGAKGNIIANNQVSNPGQQGTNVDMYGNTGTKSQPIRVDTSASITSDANIIQANQCYDDQTAASPSSGASVNNAISLVVNAVDNQVVNNRFAGFTSTDPISDAGTRTRISGNVGVTYVRPKTVNYTMLSSDSIISATTGAGGITITLPDATKVAVGQPYVITKVDAGAGALTVAAVAGTINGAATITVTTQFSSRTFVSDGTNWIVIASNGA
jgi:parallel beta-helix repeat protein